MTFKPKRAEIARKFDGSPELFAHCWRKYITIRAQGGFDDPECEGDVLDDLDEIASLAVNDPASQFFVYG